MKLWQLHKKLSKKALDPNNPVAEECAKSVGYRLQDKFVSLYELGQQMYAEKKRQSLSEEGGEAPSKPRSRTNRQRTSKVQPSDRQQLESPRNGKSKARKQGSK